MSEDTAVGTLPLAQRVVLCGLADLDRGGSTPAHSGEIVQTCTSLLEDADVEALGRLGEAEVSRALNRLEADDHIEMEETGERSPVGKGRPAYAPARTADDLLDDLEADEVVGPLIATLDSA